MATAPYPFPYPSAATYPHQIHHHHPFPFGFPSAYAPGPPGPVFFQPPPAQTATTAFSYASPFPYPPPASVYMPASSFSPIWPTWPPPAPDPNPYTAPFHSSSTTTSSPPNFPVASGNNFSPAAPPIPPGDLETRTTGAPLPAASTSWYPTHHTSVHLPVQATPQLNAAPAVPDREYRPPQRHAFTPTSTPCDETEEDNGALPRYDCAFQTGKSGSVFHRAAPDLTRGNDAGGEFISDEEFVHKHTGLATNTTSSRLSSVLSMPSSTGAAATSSAGSLNSHFGASFVASVPTFAFAFATNGSTKPSATAHVAGQVFGKMRTPISWQETHGTAPDYCSGHHNPIQSSCVSNLSEQNLDGMPQPCGFNNLNRQSIILADGTEHNYFTLPADYPLERAVPEPVFDVYDDEMEGCSIEFVDVLAGISEQHTYEEQQQESNQPPKCFSKPILSPERPTFGTVGVLSLTTEQKPDKELIVVCVNKASNNSFSEDATIFPSIHVPLFVGGSIECSQSHNKIELPSLTDCDLCCEHGKAQVHNHQGNMLLTKRRDKWDPGIRKTIMDIPQVVKWSSLILVSSPLSMLWDPGASLPPISTKTQQLDQASQPAIHATTLVDTFEKLHVHEKVAPLAGSSVTGFSGYKCLSFWIQNNICVCWKSEIGMTTYFSWDPGVPTLKDTVLDKCAVQVQFVQQSTKLSLFSLEFSISSPKRMSWDPGILGIDQLEMSKLIDQLEFVSQQCIHENYKANHLLLSSQDRLRSEKLILSSRHFDLHDMDE